MAEPHVLFVCPHGAAKSVLAAMHFQQLAARRGLRVGATFAGTAPDAAIAPRVVKELLSEGIDLQGVRPSLVTSEDVAAASRIVTFGCGLGALEPHVPVVQGATAAATGAITGSVVLLAQRVIYDVPTAVIALAGLAVLWRFKVPEPIVVLVAGGLGVIIWPLIRGGAP